MKLTICIEGKSVQWVVQYLDLPIETPLTPRLARDAVHALFPGVHEGIVWHGLRGYRLYTNTWKSIRRLRTTGPQHEFYVGSGVVPVSRPPQKRSTAKGSR